MRCLSLQAGSKIGCLVILGRMLVLSSRPGYSVDHDLELWTWEKFRIDFDTLNLPGDHQLYFEDVNRFNEEISRQFQTHQQLGVQFDLPWFEGWAVMPPYKYIDNTIFK